jgi:Protein of unknown function (DUF3489)
VSAGAINVITLRGEQGFAMATIFTINSNDEILTSTATPSTVIEGRRFTGPEELAELMADWPMARLVNAWNRLPGVSPVQRFTDRKTGIVRIWKAAQELHAEVPAQVRSRGLSAGQERRPSAARTNRARKPTKTETVLQLLREPQGATIKALMQVTGWQAHSVRGFLSACVRKKMGLPVRSSLRESERVYTITAAGHQAI